MKLILTGGFLGSGKTTAIVNACHLLMKGSTKVAVITNDQGNQQVDSEYVKAFGITHGEVANGCFCCKYEEFNEKLSNLMHEATPDVIFAEAVGSCADLVATVAKPLKKYRPDLQVVISVFVDITLLSAILEQRASFVTESVRYIFKKQMEEADILVISKKDCATAETLNLIQTVLTSEYPAKVLLLQDSFHQDDIRRWMKVCGEFQTERERKSLDIDYQIYSKGESELSWADQVITIESPTKDAVSAAEHFIGNIFDGIQKERLTIGHLKFFVESDAGVQKVSFTTMSSSSSVQLNLPPAGKIKMMVNARIQSSPMMLAAIIESALANSQKVFNCIIKSAGESVFSPGYPMSTHRF
jgi:G3E family GTPase